MTCRTHAKLQLLDEQHLQAHEEEEETEQDTVVPPYMGRIVLIACCHILRASDAALSCDAASDCAQLIWSNSVAVLSVEPS